MESAHRRGVVLRLRLADLPVAIQVNLVPWRAVESGEVHFYPRRSFCEPTILLTSNAENDVLTNHFFQFLYPILHLGE